MSKIPFVNQLGDALQSAITTTANAPRRPRRPRRLWLYVALGGLVVGTGAAGAAGLLSGSQEQAANSIACYDSASDRGNVTVIFAADQSPATACANELRRNGERVSALVACSEREREYVAVIPGRTSADCTRNGLRPLAGGYEPARAKIARLQRALVRLEKHLDCVTPAELASRVQAILDRDGWTGWTARVQNIGAGRDGPCGAVTTAGGRPGRTLAGALDVGGRQVRVYRDIPRALFELLYGREGLAPRLEDHSGTACFTVRQLVTHADRALADTKLRARALAPVPRQANTGFTGPRQARYEAGCAIVTDVTAGRRPGTIALAVMQKR